MEKPSMDQYLPQIDREKIARLLEIRKRYDEGKITLEEGRVLLKAQVGTIRAYELAFAEQEFKAFEDDECRKEDIQAMMDLYQDIWDTSRPELPTDHPLMCYYRENDAMRKLLLAVEDLVQYPVIRNQWYELYDELAKFRIHLSRKQNQLYSILERKGFDRPTTTMWLLDDFIRDEIRDVRKLLEDGKEDEFIEKQKTIVADIRDLMQKEEQVLYPTSLVMIKPEEFEDMKEGDREIGFAWIDVTPAEATTKTTTSTPPSAGSLEKDLLALLAKHGYSTESVASDQKLDVATGKLTLEQINLIFKHLPVDLSYVDENELVCFYSDTEHRVFPRSKNVIGRDVKNCHPRTSVHIVEEIIAKFRSGEADTVDFWINKPDFFVYITYTAVRDETGRFRGILEMMQNCTHIRALEGSRTLLVWSKNENGEEKRVEEEVTVEDEKSADIPEGIDRKTMHVTPETRLKDLLVVCPELKGELPKINSAFKMLNTPLARVMLPKATVNMMSERSGMPLPELIKAIEEVLRR